MKLVLSPAKSLNFESELPTNKVSESCFLKESERLNKLLKKKSAKSLSKLMKISDNLGQLNYERNQEWELPFTKDNARQAVYAFSGDVYRGLDAYTIPKDKLEKVQDTVRIISGLYGLLKPLDLMQPYRLEMGTKFPVGKNKNLYEFWKQKVTKALNDELEEEMAKNEVLSASFDDELLNYLPSESFALLTASISTKNIISALEEKVPGFDRNSDEFERETGMSADEAINSINGSGVVSLIGFEDVTYDYMGYEYVDNQYQRVPKTRTELLPMFGAVVGLNNTDLIDEIMKKGLEANGIEKIVDIPLSDAEKAHMQQSAEGVKKTNGLLEL